MSLSKDRVSLFESFGFECVGGEVALGIFNAFDGDKADFLDPDLTIWVDFKKKRVMLDPGDGGEPYLLKGVLLKSEVKEYNQYEEDIERMISDAHNNSEQSEETC